MAATKTEEKGDTMIKALQAPQIAQDAPQAWGVPMNPTSILWPLWRDPNAPEQHVQKSAKTRRQAREDNFIILNPGNT